MILEGIVTTTGADGRAHLASMGAVVDDPRDRTIERIVLRPYRSSTTYANLSRAGEAVFHVTDDVGMIARAAVGKLDPLPQLRRAAGVDGWIVADACRWYALRAKRIDDSGARACVEADVVGHGSIRDFCGLNRGMYAVVEGAIFASRIGLLSAGEVMAALAPLAVLVEKTGGPRERDAWAFLESYVLDKAEEGK
ncbi:MAG: DUF447 family protein [Rhodopirellula sp.]|nr:DUF447 family protein [Rhodopirellula sp.]